MQQLLRFPLRFYAVLCLVVIGVSAQTPNITSDSVPPAITAGGTHQFTADQAVTWSVTGGGTIDSNGLYQAPAVVRPKNQSRGCQLLPNNNAYNTRVDGLPVHPRSAQWLQRAIDYGPTTSAFHALSMGGKPPVFGFYDNVVDNSTPLQHMWEYYVDPFNGVPMPMPFDASKIAQLGWNYKTDDGRDHHVFRINKDTCVDYEQYQRYQDFSNPVFTAGNPTRVSYTTSQLAPSATPMLVVVAGGSGCWAAANGKWPAQVIDLTHIALPVDTSACGTPSPAPYLCSNAAVTCRATTQNINTQGADVFFPDSNTIVWGADAGRSPISATSLHSQEWYDAVQTCLAAGNCATADVGHALRTVLSNGYLSSYFVWPAVGAAGGVGNYYATNGHWDPASGTTIFTVNGSISAVTPCPGWVATPGCHFQILFLQQNANSSFSGTLTGSWAALNSSGPFDAAAIQATVVDNTHFSVAVNSSTWGAQTPASAHLYYDFIPDGAHFRLRSSFSNASVCTTESWCPYAQVLLNTLKHYGFVLLDGTLPGDNWDMGTVNSEFNTRAMALAEIYLNSYFNNLSHPFDRVIEVVDNRSLRVNPGDQHDLTTSIDRVTVTARTAGGSKSVDILPLGTTVGVFPELISIATGSTYQFHPWVNNNENTDVTYSMPNDIPGLSISSTGLLTAPPLGTTYTLIPSTIVTITSEADPSAHVYVTVEVIPTSPDGKIRVLGAGNYWRAGVWAPTYTDSSGFVWVGGTQSTRPWPENWRIPMTDNAVALSTSDKIATWVGPKPDGNLYWNVYETAFNDVVSRLVVPNGTYKVTLYGSPNWKAAQLGAAAYDWELQGVTAASRVDAYAQSGRSLNQGYTLTGIATVTNGMLISGIRNRVYSGANPYGALLGAIKIEPVSGPLAIAQTGALPVGTNKIAYNALLQAYGGTAPYRFSLVAGSLPPGVTLTSNGTLSGIPSAGGVYSFQVSVTDSAVNPATAIANTTLTIVVP